MLLAYTAALRASVAYLKRALEINPASRRARRGMHWALKRLRSNPAGRPVRPRVIFPTAPDAEVRSQPALWPWLAALAIAAAMLLYGFGEIQLEQVFARSRNGAPALAALIKPTYTPTPTVTATPTPTITPSPTPTATPTATATPTVTATATEPPIQLPAGVSEGEHWIDVDLTNQQVHAYAGAQLIRSFIVSTGTARTPTVTGQYRIYVKYRYADMSGPGYYLRDVPFVMYFYRGYGLHGTYWHNNFGTPMSHGCVNLTIPASEWVYDFAQVGTVVNIHY